MYIFVQPKECKRLIYQIRELQIYCSKYLFIIQYMIVFLCILHRYRCVISKTIFSYISGIKVFLYSHFTLFAWYQILQSIYITIYHRSIWIMLNSHKQLKRSWDDPIPTYKIGSRLDVFIAERKWYEVGNVKNTSNTRVSSELTGKMSLG